MLRCGARTWIWMSAPAISALAVLAFSSCESESPRDRLAKQGIALTPQAFIEQVKEGDSATVELMLEAGIDANTHDPAGVAAIAWAVNRRDAAMVEALAAKGADLDRPVGNDGMTLLMLAAQRADVSTVRALVNAGTPVDQRDGFGNTALMQAVAAGKSDTVEYLLEAGADASASTTESKATPLGLAAAAGRAQIARSLLAHGANPEPREASFGMTPLAVAAFKGHLETVRVLLEGGADANAVDKDGQTPRMIAAAHGHGDVVALLDRAVPGARAQRPRLFAATSRFVPPRGWELADPFTDQTRYWPGKSRLRTVRDPAGTRRALLRDRESGPQQAFLILGPASHWAAQLTAQRTELESHPLVTVRKRDETSTRDGVKVSYRVYRMAPGLIGGEDVTYLLASADLGERMFIVDAGGSSDSFSPETVVAIIQSLDLKADLGLGAGGSDGAP